MVFADQYPYNAASTILSASLDALGPDSDTGAVNVVIASCAAKPDWQGQSVAQIASDLGLTPPAAGQAILQADPNTTVILHSMIESDVRTVMAHPSTMIGSDGIPTLDAKPHPRLSSSFARVLGHYCRELELFDLAQAVHRMTGMSADAFGLADRGYIRPGAFADLVLFDEQTIIDRATFADPLLTPTGIHEVVVNGQVVIDQGNYTGALPGRALRRTVG